MKSRFVIHGLPELEKVLLDLSQEDYREVVDKNITQLYNRGAKTGASGGGTPVDAGYLRSSRGMHINISTGQFGGSFGYRAEYAPHVEFGHRTTGGGYVTGQRFLQNNVTKQRPILKKDLTDRIRKLTRG